jgi:hypothetical protein
VPIRIDKPAAAALVKKAAVEAAKGPIDANWEQKIEKLSRLCAEGVSKTHIAFLGTSIIAKAIAPTADLFAIKPDHAPNNPTAYSARTLSEQVLVPLAAELGFNIGVTGRQPLNNQPYFRMTSLGDDTPVHTGGKAAFDNMVSLVEELQKGSQQQAQAALVAYIAVRRRYQPRYGAHSGGASISPEQLVTEVTKFVEQNSENGRRAQAIVAGLMDTTVGVERVESGRINDPSRKYPGDVCIRAVDETEGWEKAFEVRDKPVSFSDVQIFAKKCIDMGVRSAAVVMVSAQQTKLDGTKLASWANDFGIGLTLFYGWQAIISQALFWSHDPTPVSATKAAAFIHERLVAVEVSPAAVELWQKAIA